MFTCIITCFGNMNIEMTQTHNMIHKRCPCSAYRLCDATCVIVAAVTAECQPCGACVCGESRAGINRRLSTAPRLDTWDASTWLHGRRYLNISSGMFKYLVVGKKERLVGPVICFYYQNYKKRFIFIPVITSLQEQVLINSIFQLIRFFIQQNLRLMFLIKQTILYDLL